MTSYSDYYESKNTLEDLMPGKYYINHKLVPEVIKLKATELRLLIIGALAELNEAGWEDDE